MKGTKFRTMKSSVAVEILPGDDWEVVAYMSIKGLAVQAAGLQRQMREGLGAKRLGEAVEALEAAAEEIAEADDRLV